MDVTAGIKATQTGFSLVKGIREALKGKEVDPHEISNRLMEVQELLLELQSALSDAREDNRKLKAALEDRSNLLELENDVEVIEDGQFCIRQSEREAGKYVPYCPVCWGESRKLIPLAPHAKPGTFVCAIHKVYYATTKYRDFLKAANEKAKQQRELQRNSNGPQGWMAR